MKNRANNSHQQEGKVSMRDFVGTVAAAAVIEAYRTCGDF